jgi:hypothetical protein
VALLQWPAADDNAVGDAESGGPTVVAVVAANASAQHFKPLVTRVLPFNRSKYRPVFFQGIGKSEPAGLV